MTDRKRPRQMEFIWIAKDVRYKPPRQMPLPFPRVVVKVGSTKQVKQQSVNSK